MISLRQQIEELDRELEQRARIYARLVSSGKLRQSLADFQIARLAAARDTLVWLVEHESTIKQRLVQ
jgi:predicted nucleic acid-binding protein